MSSTIESVDNKTGYRVIVCDVCGKKWTSDDWKSPVVRGCDSCETIQTSSILNPHFNPVYDGFD